MLHIRKSSSYILLAALSTLTSQASANTFEVVDFDFALACDQKPNISNPQFPDSQVTNKQLPSNPIFQDGVYSGHAPASTATSDIVQKYVSFDYFNTPVSNYTAQTGIDNGSHPPPTFNLSTLKADLSSFYAWWNGTEFSQGNSDVDMVDNLDGTYTIDYLSLISGGPFNGCTGRWKMVLNCTTCVPTQVGVADTLTASQGGGADTRIITTGGGSVVISSSFGASPSNFVDTWTPPDPLILDTDSSIGTYTFDPSSLSPGFYTFQLTYQDNSTSPATKGIGEITLKVVASTTGDIADDDNDGIPNKDDDASLTATQLQSTIGNNSSYLLESSTGRLTLGSTAFCSGNAVKISTTDIENYAGAGCTPVTNASDDQIKRVGIGGYFDFEIHDVAMGGQVQVVLPLNDTLPSHATYRHYFASSGWSIFDATGSDRIASAKSTATGVCPGPSSSTYTNGLAAGNDCVRLTITDGGPNDADKSANGLIKDPGTFAEIQSGVDAKLAGGGWMLLLAFPFLIGMRYFKRKRIHNK